jgi:hypothetical protein
VSERARGRRETRSQNERARRCRGAAAARSTDRRSQNKTHVSPSAAADLSPPPCCAADEVCRPADAAIDEARHRAHGQEPDARPGGAPAPAPAPLAAPPLLLLLLLHATAEIAPPSCSARSAAQPARASARGSSACASVRSIGLRVVVVVVGLVFRDRSIRREELRGPRGAQRGRALGNRSTCVCEDASVRESRSKGGADRSLARSPPRARAPSTPPPTLARGALSPESFLRPRPAAAHTHTRTQGFLVAQVHRAALPHHTPPSFATTTTHHQPAATPAAGCARHWPAGPTATSSAPLIPASRASSHRARAPQATPRVRSTISRRPRGHRCSSRAPQSQQQPQQQSRFTARG